MSEAITGQCHCGSVSWSVELPPKIALNCHCKLCRQLTGAAVSAWVVFPEQQYRVEQGADKLRTYAASANFIKHFCIQCGGTVHCVNKDKFPGHIYLQRASLPGELDLAPDIQVYTDDKAQWVTLDEEIPVFNP